jgi:hypothetical protein
MQQVVGTAHITERADSVAPVHDWEAFLSAAKSMDIGIRILAQSLPEATLPLAILCGQASECGLKALLSHSGIKTNMLRSKSFGHNLVALWIAAASSANLQPSCPPPGLNSLGVFTVSHTSSDIPWASRALSCPPLSQCLLGQQSYCHSRKRGLQRDVCLHDVN